MNIFQRQMVDLRIEIFIWITWNSHYQRSWWRTLAAYIAGLNACLIWLMGMTYRINGTCMKWDCFSRRYLIDYNWFSDLRSISYDKKKLLSNVVLISDPRTLFCFFDKTTSKSKGIKNQNKVWQQLFLS